MNYELLRNEFKPRYRHCIGKMKQFKVKLHIDPAITPVTQKHRCVGFHLREAVADEIEKLLQADIIEPLTNDPTPWVSPCIVVPKPKQPGKLRVYVDMRAPDKAILMVTTGKAMVTTEKKSKIHAIDKAAP